MKVFRKAAFTLNFQKKEVVSDDPEFKVSLSLISSISLTKTVWGKKDIKNNLIIFALDQAGSRSKST